MKKFAFFVCLVATFVAVPAAIADGGAGDGAQSEAEVHADVLCAYGRRKLLPALRTWNGNGGVSQALARWNYRWPRWMERGEGADRRHDRSRAWIIGELHVPQGKAVFDGFIAG